MAKNFKQIKLYAGGKGKKSRQGAGGRTKVGKKKGQIKKYRGQGGPKRRIR